MGYSDSCVRIERFTNGFTVEIKDPAIIKRNAANDKLKYDDKNRKPYVDPWRSFVFKTADEVVGFLGKNLKKAIVSKGDDDGDEYGTAFDMASAASDNDGDEG